MLRPIFDRGLSSALIDLISALITGVICSHFKRFETGSQASRTIRLVTGKISNIRDRITIALMRDSSLESILDGFNVAGSARVSHYYDASDNGYYEY